MRDAATLSLTHPRHPMFAQEVNRSPFAPPCRRFKAPAHCQQQIKQNDDYEPQLSPACLVKSHRLPISYRSVLCSINSQRSEDLKTSRRIFSGAKAASADAILEMQDPWDQIAEKSVDLKSKLTTQQSSGPTAPQSPALWSRRRDRRPGGRAAEFIILGATGRMECCSQTKDGNGYRLHRPRRVSDTRPTPRIVLCGVYGMTEPDNPGTDFCGIFQIYLLHLNRLSVVVHIEGNG